MKVVTIKVEQFGWDLLVALVGLLHTVEGSDNVPDEITEAAAEARAAVEAWSERPFE